MKTFDKLIVLKTVEACHYSLLICLPNERIAINIIQRSRLTFDLSA